MLFFIENFAERTNNTEIIKHILDLKTVLEKQTVSRMKQATLFDFWNKNE